MKLSQALNIEAVKNIILVGTPEMSNFVTSDEEAYFVCKTKKPVMVTCSVDSLIEPHEVDEVYIRQSALDLDGWKWVDETKPEEGFYMEGWKVDFSKSQQLAVYQETTIAKYFRDQRGAKNDERRTGINKRIQDAKAKRAGK